ncbi:MAG: DNA adenine methylase [Thermofilum sp.]|jgi:DNA adenine methylase|uniref:DNA adenine methylase n=1 Tax=Thermofilum sp. TaxID=1961369 RepID=UPI0025890AF8|nr:DNA adenine methylase [Thermofilum sp.]MCI4409355.1 DNA adenine methylase [Thermofilum sp.]
MSVKTKQASKAKSSQKTQQETEAMVYPEEQKSESEVSNDELRSLIFNELKKDFTQRYKEGKPTKTFKYIGGDWKLKDKILPIITQSGATKLVEVFGGSGVITQFAPREQFKSIVYNDKDSLLTNFFLVLRDHPKELTEKIFFLPSSRELFHKYREMVQKGELNKLDPISKAVIAFYLLNDSFFGQGRTWAIDHHKSVSVELRRKALALADLAKRWLDVDIENNDFRKILDTHDKPYTVFYIDPPFFSKKDTDRDYYYRLSFTEKDMKDLLDILSKIRGKFVLKLPKDHLEIPYIKEWIDNHGYYVTLINHKLNMENKEGEERDEFTTVLIHNFPAKLE